MPYGFCRLLFFLRFSFVCNWLPEPPQFGAEIRWSFPSLLFNWKHGRWVFLFGPGSSTLTASRSAATFLAALSLVSDWLMAWRCLPDFSSSDFHCPIFIGRFLWADFYGPIFIGQVYWAILEHLHPLIGTPSSVVIQLHPSQLGELWLIRHFQRDAITFAGWDWIILSGFRYYRKPGNLSAHRRDNCDKRWNIPDDSNWIHWVELDIGWRKDLISTWEIISCDQSLVLESE